jgi:hypothetical protein
MTSEGLHDMKFLILGVELSRMQQRDRIDVTDSVNDGPVMRQ